MNKVSILILLITYVVLYSCTPPVIFDGPFPPDGKDLLSIPSNYQGLYVCDSDSAIVSIKPDLITRRQQLYFQTPLSAIKQRTDCVIFEHEIYLKEENICIPIEYVDEDIVRGQYEEIDTFFMFSSSSNARLYQGHLILSQELKPDQWALNILSLDKETNITYRAITAQSEIDEVKKITPLENLNTVNNGRDRYLIHPTLAEFDQLLNNDEVFIECEYLQRINSIIPLNL